MIRLRRWMVLTSALCACAAPQTQIGSVSADQVAIEQARQQQFVLENDLKLSERLQQIAVPILIAAAPLCGDRIQQIIGLSVANVFRFPAKVANTALSLGFNDTLVVLQAPPGGPAGKAGLVKGDRIIALNGVDLQQGKDALASWSSRTATGKKKSLDRFSITYRRGAETVTTSLEPEWACAYTPLVEQDDNVNAHADGQTLRISTGIMRFLPDDDELAVVVGHELAHNAMRHIDAQMKNALAGGLLGAVADIAAAAAGVNTKGEFTKTGIKTGSMVFSQDFEREADYVGLYILALSGRPIDNAATLWRRMAVHDPVSIKFASTHPTSAERFVRLEQWKGEINRKVAAGSPLRPELRQGSTALASDKRLPADRAVASIPRPQPNTSASLTASVEKAKVTTLAVVPSALAAPTRDGVEPNEKAKAKDKPEAREKAEPRSEPVNRTRRGSAADLARSPNSGNGAQAIIGAPSSEDERAAAIETHADGMRYVGSHKWDMAEQSFRTALKLDGSVPKYHASLDSLMMTMRRWVDAEAEFTAAMLLDVDNPKYRRLVKEARSKR